MLMMHDAWQEGIITYTLAKVRWGMGEGGGVVIMTHGQWLYSLLLRPCQASVSPMQRRRSITPGTIPAWFVTTGCKAFSERLLVLCEKINDKIEIPPWYYHIEPETV